MAIGLLVGSGEGARMSGRFRPEVARVELSVPRSAECERFMREMSTGGRWEARLSRETGAEVRADRGSRML